MFSIGTMRSVTRRIDCTDQNPFEICALVRYSGDVVSLIERTAIGPMLCNTLRHIKAFADVHDLASVHQQVHADERLHRIGILAAARAHDSAG